MSQIFVTLRHLALKKSDQKTVTNPEDCTGLSIIALIPKRLFPQPWIQTAQDSQPASQAHQTQTDNRQLQEAQSPRFSSGLGDFEV